MDKDKAAIEVADNLRSVARALRTLTGDPHRRDALTPLAERLDHVASRMIVFGGIELRGARRSGTDAADPEMLGDTLILLDAFRHIKTSAARRSVVDLVRALRPDEPDGFV